MLRKFIEYRARKKRAKRFKMYQLPKESPIRESSQRENDMQLCHINISREGTGYDYQNTAIL